MKENKFTELLKSLGALWLHRGGKAPHALLTSGMHSNGYVNMTKVVERPDAAAEFCKALVGKLALKNPPDLVIGSAMGAITIAYQVASLFGGKTRAAYTEKEDDGMALKRFEVARGEKALVVEDVMTSGGTTVKTIEALLKAGVQALPVCGVLVNRSGSDKLSAGGREFKIASVVSLEIAAWDSAACPLCKSGSEALRPKQHWAKLTNPS